MEQFEIRQASKEDSASLADLARQLGYPTTAEEAADRLVALGSGEHLVLVACAAGGMVVGWVHVFEALRIESGRFAELGGFIVHEAYRGRGIGRTLLISAEDWVQDRGIGKLRVRSRSTRPDAHGFYERLGFSRIKNQTVFDKSVRAGGQDETTSGSEPIKRRPPGQTGPHP